MDLVATAQKSECMEASSTVIGWLPSNGCHPITVPDASIHAGFFLYRTWRFGCFFIITQKESILFRSDVVKYVAILAVHLEVLFFFCESPWDMFVRSARIWCCEGCLHQCRLLYDFFANQPDIRMFVKSVQV